MAELSVTQWNNEDQIIEDVGLGRAELSGRMRLCA